MSGHKLMFSQVWILSRMEFASTSAPFHASQYCHEADFVVPVCVLPIPHQPLEQPIDPPESDQLET
jgi:hypothetical protein